MKKLEDNLPDIFLLVGFILLCIGLWLIYPPSSFVVGGILLLKAGLPPNPKKKKGGGD